MNARLDTSEIARQIRIPTLVLHNRGDRMVPPEQGRKVARLVPGAQFVKLPGNNHVAFEGTPEFDRFFEEVRAFLAEHP